MFLVKHNLTYFDDKLYVEIDDKIVEFEQI